MSIFKPVTVITGASGGIGEALARVFARNGHEVALVARREKEMTLLATELAVSCKYRPHVVVAPAAIVTAALLAPVALDVLDALAAMDIAAVSPAATAAIQSVTARTSGSVIQSASSRGSSASGSACDRRSRSVTVSAARCNVARSQSRSSRSSGAQAWATPCSGSLPAVALWSAVA